MKLNNIILNAVEASLINHKKYKKYKKYNFFSFFNSSKKEKQKIFDENSFNKFVTLNLLVFSDNDNVLIIIFIKEKFRIECEF
jgi:archaellin